MSISNVEGLKVILPKIQEDAFWVTVPKDFAKGNRLRWKYLAMLALKVNGGWTLTDIGKAFGHPKGHVARSIKTIKTELRQRYHYNPKSHHTESTPQDRNPQWETESV